MKRQDTNLILRARVIRSIRDFFTDRGFLEVDTPLRIPANAPEEHIQPVGSDGMYLHTSPELCMKRLLARGHQAVFQICRCWRQGERGSRHLPEFLMLEWYRAGGDYYDLMRDCEELLLHVTRQCLDTSAISYRGDRIAFHEGMHILKVADVFLDYCGISVTEAVADSTFDELMGLRIEPALPRDKPVILTDYPAQMAALSRLKQSDPAVAERFELYVGGLELANGFSELVDPDEQRRRFYEANRSREAAGMSGLPLPDRFLDELALMPESAGIALGVDRLVMLCAGEDAIDAVVPFTPEQL